MRGERGDKMSEGRWEEGGGMQGVSGDTRSKGAWGE